MSSFKHQRGPILEEHGKRYAICEVCGLAVSPELWPREKCDPGVLAGDDLRGLSSTEAGFELGLKAKAAAEHETALAKAKALRAAMELPRDQRGLYQKFIVIREDGRSAEGQRHYGCQYFVLDMDHDRHSVAALLAYADSCEVEYPGLAADIREWLKLETLTVEPGDV